MARLFYLSMHLLMDENNESLSSRLRYALKILNISQTELARRINIKPQAIQYLCASDSKKSKFTFEIAEALNIDFSWLAIGKGIEPGKIFAIKNEKSVPLLSFNQIREWKIYNHTLKLTKDNINIPVTEDISENSFAVRLNDRAMSPKFDLETIIIVDPTLSISIAQITNHCYALVYIAQEDFIVFRNLVVIDNIKQLSPINSHIYKNITLQENDVILGICREARWNI